MRYIKRIFEDNEFENEPAFGEGRIYFVPITLYYLPAAKLKEVINEFEDLLSLLINIIDNGFNVTFCSAYGQRVFLSYEDYIAKNENWVEFINAYPKFRTIEIRITNDNKFDNNLLSDFITTEYDDLLQKSKLYNWEHQSTNISINTDKYKNPLVIRIEIEKNR